MSDDTNQGWAPRAMTITVIDKGQSHQVSNVDPWVEERKTLLRQGHDLVNDYDGNPRSLYPQHNTLVTIAKRLAEIKVIFDTYNRERNRQADANITALATYFTDPKTLEGIDD